MALPDLFCNLQSYAPVLTRILLDSTARKLDNFGHFCYKYADYQTT